MLHKGGRARGAGGGEEKRELKGGNGERKKGKEEGMERVGRRREAAGRGVGEKRMRERGARSGRRGRGEAGRDGKWVRAGLSVAVYLPHLQICSSCSCCSADIIPIITFHDMP